MKDLIVTVVFGICIIGVIVAKMLGYLSFDDMFGRILLIIVVFAVLVCSGGSGRTSPPADDDSPGDMGNYFR